MNECEGRNEWMNEWMNEWVCEWVNQLRDKWVGSKLINEVKGFNHQVICFINCFQIILNDVNLLFQLSPIIPIIIIPIIIILIIT